MDIRENEAFARQARPDRKRALHPAVHLDRAFLARRDIKDVLPKPDATRIDADGVTYVFGPGGDHRGEVTATPAGVIA